MKLSKLNMFKSVTNLEKDKISFSECGFFKGLLIVFFYFIIVNSTFSSPIYLLEGYNTIYYQFIKILLSIIATSLSIFLFTKMFSYNINKNVTHKKFSKNNFIFIFLFILGFRLLFDGSLSYLIDLIPESEILKSLDNSLTLDPIYTIFTIIIIAPIEEEFLMRGIVLNKLLKKYSSKVAVVVSALIFAIVHLNFQQGINAFMLGLFLGYIYIKTKSIYLTIFAHFCNNTIIFPLTLISLIPINSIIINIFSTVIGAILMFYSFKNSNLISFNWEEYRKTDFNLELL